MEEFSKQIINALPVGLMALAGGWIGNAVHSYFQEKGKNLATKEDIKEITEKIEFVKNQFGKRHLRSKAYIERQIAAYDEICQRLYEIKTLSYEINPVIEFIDAHTRSVCKSQYELSKSLLDKLEESQIYVSPYVNMAVTSVSEELYNLSEAQYHASNMADLDKIMGVDNRIRTLDQWNLVRNLIDDAQLLIRRELIDE